MNELHYHTMIEGVPNAQQWQNIAAERVYPQVFRRDFSFPGVALLSFQENIASTHLRLFMWTLKQTLSNMHYQTTGKRLVYLSMGRFDSQVTTKFHLDGAPDEAFLMLGYEQSQVQSELAIADYSRAAHDWGIIPRRLLDEFNPMYADNEKRLLPYIVRLTAFTPTRPHILLLNNSAMPYCPNSKNLLGVMHQATIKPDAQAERIINSTMITTSNDADSEPVDSATQQRFLTTSEISGS